MRIRTLRFWIVMNDLKTISMHKLTSILLCRFQQVYLREKRKKKHPHPPPPNSRNWSVVFILHRHTCTSTTRVGSIFRNGKIYIYNLKREKKCYFCLNNPSSWPLSVLSSCRLGTASVSWLRGLFSGLKFLSDHTFSSTELNLNLTLFWSCTQTKNRSSLSFIPFIFKGLIFMYRQRAMHIPTGSFFLLHHFFLFFLSCCLHYTVHTPSL